MRRIETEKRQVPGGGAAGAADDPLDARRAALRRAVDELGQATTRLRTQQAMSSAEPPTAERIATAALAASGVAEPASNGESPPIAPRPVAPPPVVPQAPAPSAPNPEATARRTVPLGDSAMLRERERMMADARQRFEFASQQADALVRTITQAIQSETDVFRSDVEASVEASVEARWRQVDVEVQRRMRRAELDADALVEQRRRRIAEISDRILELGESLAGRLNDADHVKDQFDTFVHSLSLASDRLATVSSDPSANVTAMPDHGAAQHASLAEAA